MMKKTRFIALLLAMLMMWQMLPIQALSETVVSGGVSLAGNLGAGAPKGGPVYHTVHFADYNGTPLSTVENVLDGTRLDSIAPTAPTRTGYTFVQWTPPETYITGDTPTEFFFTAQYRSTKLYDLHIKYVYENNSPAALPYQATLPYGEAYQVASPTIQGFYVDPADDEMISEPPRAGYGRYPARPYRRLQQHRHPYRSSITCKTSAMMITPWPWS